MSEHTARSKLLAHMQKRSLITGQAFTLSAGKSANYYFDCKQATLDGEALGYVADALLAEIEQLPIQPDAIAGLTLGADPIVAAVAMRACQVGRQPTHATIVRKDTKQHGTMKNIENPPPAGARIAVVDDVITSGSSARIACEALIAAGYEVCAILCLVDRLEGGMQALTADFNCRGVALFDLNDFNLD